MRLIFLLYLISAPILAFAETDCLVRGASPDQNSADIISVAASGGGALNPFASTGVMNCDGMEFTAQVTGKSNVLTSVAHGFLLPNCDKRQNCFFKIMGIEYSVDMSSLAHGSCPNVFEDNFQDWATIKLIEDVDGVTPYQIPDFSNRLRAGDEVVTVSGLNPSGGTEITPLACKVDQIGQPQHVPINIGNSETCRTFPGSSGSAQLKPTGNGQFHLMSVHIGNSEPDNSGYNISIPLRGDFLAAVQANMQ